MMRERRLDDETTKKPYNDVKFKQLDQKNIHNISLERGDERVEKTA